MPDSGPGTTPGSRPGSGPQNYDTLLDTYRPIEFFLARPGGYLRPITARRRFKPPKRR
jgi:hypothetical protein